VVALKNYPLKLQSLMIKTLRIVKILRVKAAINELGVS
jgi:hypothetical protein